MDVKKSHFINDRGNTFLKGIIDKQVKDVPLRD